MKSQIYSVRDLKSNVFLMPMFVMDETVALRSFEATAKDSRSNICIHPEDYSLYHMGEFNSETGTLDSLAEPKPITNAVAVQAKIVPTIIKETQLIEKRLILLEEKLDAMEAK